MSAYTDLQRNADKKMEATDLEMCVLYCGDKQKYDLSYINTEAAAAELAAKDAEIERLLVEVNNLKYLKVVADSVNEWLVNNGLGNTGHQRELEAALQEAQ